MATEKEIMAAADAITAEGGNPTLAAVRQRVGGGSFTGISAAMQRWRAERAAQQPQEPAQTPIPDALMQHARVWWEGAVTLARDELQAEREALAGERREIERQRAEAAELADQLAAELDETRAQIVRLEGATERLEVAKAENARQADELARVRAEAERARIAEQAGQARLESAARELEDMRQRVREAEERARKTGEEAAELRGRLAVFEVKGNGRAPAAVADDRQSGLFEGQQEEKKTARRARKGFGDQ